MARVTVEDCVEEIKNKNRFELVALASQRAKAIGCGAPIMVERDNDKNAVIALREIAGRKINISQLYEDLISSLQTRNKVDTIEEENLHAEAQENVAEEIELAEENIHVFDHSSHPDFEIGDFDDNVSGEDK